MPQRLVTKEAFCSSTGVPRSSFWRLTAKARLSLHRSPPWLLPRLSAVLRQDADQRAPSTSQGLGDSWRWQNAHFSSLEIRTLHTEYNKSPAIYPGLLTSIIEGLRFISLIQKKLYYSTPCEIRDIGSDILHLSRDLVFRIFSLANSCFHTEEYFCPERLSQEPNTRVELKSVLPRAAFPLLFT